MYEVGTVFLWRDFPLQKDNFIKDRYFICLGHSSACSYQINVYTVTPTTRTQHYEVGGKREGVRHIHIPANSFGLPYESIVDVDTWFDDCFMETVQENKSKITQVGKVDEGVLVKIYNLVLTSSRISPNIKRDIYGSFRDCGISGIKELSTKRKRGKY